MKNTNFEEYRELSNEEMSSIVGGDSIAYRIGQAIRFSFIAAFESTYHAIADLSVNEAVNAD